MYDVILTCNYSPWSAYSGGGQKSTHMLATALAASGKKVCVVYSKGFFERIRVPDGLPYRVAWAFFAAVKPGISSPLRFLNGIFFYFKVRGLSGRGTVLHGNGDEAALLGLIREKKTFIYGNRYPAFEGFMHRVDWRSPLALLKVFLREPRYAAMAMALRGADAVACTSASSVRELAACFPVPESKVRIIPNGIDPVFLEAPLPARAGRGILFFGRVTFAKGVDLLLRAYAALPEAQRDEHPLTLVGEGPYLRELRALAKELGLEERLRLEPWASPAVLARKMAEQALVVLPSREESFGNTMLEALAAGQRLVTSDAGSVPEVVGGHASIVPAGDYRALGVEMRRLLDEAPDPERARACREYVRGKYSWEGTARSFAELYSG